MFSALYEADINVRLIDQGSSELNIIIGVDNKDFEKSIERFTTRLWIKFFKNPN